MAWTAPRTWVTSEIVTSSLMNTHVRDNLLGALGPAQGTVAALNTWWGGSPPDGATGCIRVGGAPYSYMELKYDAVTGKWTSPTVSSGWDRYGWGHNTTVSWGYSQAHEVGGSEDYSYYRAAGLALQARFIYTMQNNDGGDSYVEFHFVGEAEVGGNGADVNMHQSGWLTPGGGDQTFSPAHANPTDWVGVPGNFDGYNRLYCYGAIQSDASPDVTTTNIRYVRILTRWSS